MENDVAGNAVESDLVTLTKYLYTDEEGRYRGIANPHFLKKNNITVVGEFIKALLDSRESDDWVGWIGIMNRASEYGNPRVYYVGSTKDADGNRLPGVIEQVVDYTKDWVETNLVKVAFDNIYYVDTFGKVDWLIELKKYVDKVTE